MGGMAREECRLIKFFWEIRGVKERHIGVYYVQWCVYLLTLLFYIDQIRRCCPKPLHAFSVDPMVAFCLPTWYPLTSTLLSLPLLPICRNLSKTPSSKLLVISLLSPHPTDTQTMMVMMLIRSGNISILAQAAIIASPTTIANPNMLLYQQVQIGTESKADIRWSLISRNLVEKAH